MRWAQPQLGHPTQIIAGTKVPGLGSLWIDAPGAELANICDNLIRCEATRFKVGLRVGMG